MVLSARVHHGIMATDFHIEKSNLFNLYEIASVFRRSLFHNLLMVVVKGGMVEAME